jgi:hypothetical protein
MSWVSTSLDVLGSEIFRALLTQLIANCLLGHVIGLQHEQQRPDARESLKFDCRALQGYEEAKTLVQSVKPTDEPAFTTSMSILEKMNLVLVYLLPSSTHDSPAYTVH